jgi:hypothetical protein
VECQFQKIFLVARRFNVRSVSKNFVGLAMPQLRVRNIIKRSQITGMIRVQFFLQK